MVCCREQSTKSIFGIKLCKKVWVWGSECHSRLWHSMSSLFTHFRGHLSHCILWDWRLVTGGGALVEAVKAGDVKDLEELCWEACWEEDTSIVLISTSSSLSRLMLVVSMLVVPKQMVSMLVVTMLVVSRQLVSLGMESQLDGSWQLLHAGLISVPLKYFGM